MSPELRVLFDKEWRQLVRSKGAMLSSLLLPVFLLLVVPLFQIVTTSAVPQSAAPKLPAGVSMPPGLAALASEPRRMVLVFLPLFVAIGGMVAPSIAASYTLISERETRTIELLLALPTRIGQVLLAKLLALLALAVPVTSALLAVDCTLVLVLRLAGVGYVLALFLLLAVALGFSTASALLVSLLARDFRTSNNFNGLIFGPAIIATMAVMVTVPGPTRAALVLCGIYLAGACLCAWIAVRAVTFERLLR